MYRTQDKDIWRVFREHHYLSNEINKACQYYVGYWNNTLVSFMGVLPQPSGTLKYARRISRVVILPDYQNLGIGSKFNEFIGDLYLSNGFKVSIRTTHLRLGNYFENHSQWRSTSSNKKVSNDIGKSAKISYGVKDRELGRVAYAFEYMGKNYIDKPHIEIHIDDNSDINYDIFKQDMIYLKEKYYLCIITGEINTPSKIEDICLELGIRTQLLYNTKKGVKKIASKYKNKKIITKWDEDFSKQVRRYYNKF